MSYRPQFAASSDLGAVFIASVKAGLVGAAVVPFFVALAVGLPHIENGHDLFRTIGLGLVIFVIALVIGTIATALLTMFVGLPIAFLTRGFLASGTGLAIALVSAFALSGLTGIMIEGPGAILIVLPFSIPAAYFFREQLLIAQQFKQAEA